MMSGWNDKNKQWENLPDKKEDSNLFLISNETLSACLGAAIIFGFICGVMIGLIIGEAQYDFKIDTSELIPYETLIKKGLAKPVKDENGDLKLKLTEFK